MGAPNASRPAEPLGALAGSFARSDETAGVLHPAQAPPCLTNSKTEEQKAALHCTGLSWGCSSWVRLLQPSKKY